jgi:hypothetical protein
VALPNDWDQQGARSIREDAALFALELLYRLLTPTSPAPQIVPLAYGGLQLEWHRRGSDLEIEIAGPNRVSVSFEDPQSGIDQEIELSADLSPLPNEIRRAIDR